MSKWDWVIIGLGIWFFVSIIAGVIWAIVVGWLKSKRRARKRVIKAYMSSQAVGERARWRS